MWMEAISESSENSCQCPTCGGHVQRRIFSEMYAGAFVLNGERVEISRTPRDGFANPIVLDPLTQYFNGGLYRLWPSERYFARGGKKLHRDVWSDAFGDIPKGHHIHHKDADPANNQLSNLECLHGKEHISASTTVRNNDLKLRKANGQIAGDPFFTEAAREKAADWHRSEAGRLWHKRQAEQSQVWTKWKRVPKNCEFCGKEFEALDRKNGHPHKFCTANCKAASYRARKDA